MPDGYTPRRPEQTDLHRLVSAWWPAFRERAEEAGGLPVFVEKTFEHYLRCGILAHGFARVSCPTCRDDLLVAWSCRRRGLCPSCSGRRMADTAAHLVDRVLPDVPVRQWVLTLPFALRMRVAFDHDLAATVRNLFVATVRQAYRDGRCAELGTTATGSVTVTQRFGSALNLNPHFHSLLLDGVYHRPSSAGPLVFAPHSEPTDAMVEAVLTVFVTRLDALWRHRGYDEAAPEESPEPAPSAMDQLTLTALGLKGEPPARGRTEPPARRPWPSPRSPRRQRTRARKPLCAELDGFTLHAATAVSAGQRGELEVLCRYVLRPAVVQDRVLWRDDERVEWTLSRPWSDGTTSLVFQPLDFMARLALLIPKPYLHEIAYHGVLAPAARWRAEVVAGAPKAGGVRRPRRPCEDGHEPTAALDQGVRPRRLDWARLLWRSFTTDVLTCTTCGGRRKVLALVQDPSSIQAILTHLGLTSPTSTATPQPRGPPQRRLDLSPTT
jgi:hypothetical protein